MTTQQKARMADSLTSTFENMGKGKEAESDTLYMSRHLIRRLAAPLLPMMGLGPGTAGPVRLLDTACGTGVVVAELQGENGLPRDVLAQSSFVCADNAQGMIDLVQKRIKDDGWVNVEAKVLDAQNTGLPENSFSHVTACLALHLTPDPDAVVRDAMRVLKPGGTFGATTFPKNSDKKFWFGDLKEAFASMPFDAVLPDVMPTQTHDSGHWNDPAWIEPHLKELGLTNVSVEVKSGSAYIESAEDYIRLFSPMFAPLMKAFWSEETREAHPVAEVIELVRQFLKEKYGNERWENHWSNIYMTGTVEK